MVIYIPTYRRSRQVTWSFLSPRWLESAWLVASPDEAPQLRRAGYRVLALPEQAVGNIGATRQWILDQHDQGDRLVMMDDDLKFFRRRGDDNLKFRALEPGEFDLMMQELLELPGPLTGMANRAGANRYTDVVRHNTRIGGVLCIDVAVAREEGFRFRMDYMEDFDYHLQALTVGYSTQCLYGWCFNQVSNHGGGCATHRTLERQRAAAEALVERWPRFAKLRHVRASQGKEWAERTDVTVQWKKAAEFGRAGGYLL